MAGADIHVRVVTLDPATAQLIGVEGAQVTCKNSTWLIDGTLSTAAPTTDAQGRAKVSITFDDGAEQALNPYFQIAVPAGKRAVPPASPAALQVTLPDAWETRHAVNHRLSNITTFTDPNKPLDLFVGLPADLQIAYTDYHTFDGTTRTGLRNPLALPQDTSRVGLIDVDILFDDAMGGFGLDRAQSKLVAVGEDGFRYEDEWPTAPWAMDLTPVPTQAWLDPPGAPVGRLGGGSFVKTGMLATDRHGFVFMCDDTVVRRFYPDGTLAETITPPGPPRGLALDSYRNLFVSNGTQVDIYRPDFMENGTGVYVHERTRGGFTTPRGMTVLPSRIVDGNEFLAIADFGANQVLVYTIQILDAAGNVVARRAMTRQRVDLVSPVTVSPMAGPSDVATDAQRRLYVAEQAKHVVSRWDPDATFTAWTHQADFGSQGAGDGQFDTPSAIAADPKEGYLYVAESGNHRVQRIDTAGAHRSNLPGDAVGVAVDPVGDVFIADAAGVTRRHVYDNAGAPLPAATVPTTTGTWTPASDPAHMSAPQYVHFGADGRLWVADTSNDRVLLFARDATGELKSAPAGFPAGMANPRGVATDADGNVFVADRDRLRIFSPAFAATADGGAGAGADDFGDPRGLAVVQRTEPLAYVADAGKNRVSVRKRDGSFVKHLGGLAAPEDVAADKDGNVYVADTGNAQIVMFGPDDARVRAIALVPPTAAAGVAFGQPCGVSVDADGTLIVTDRGQQAVLRIRSDGTLVQWWDLESLTRHGSAASGTTPVLSPGRVRRYEPELARQVTFETPTKAVIDARGLLTVADPTLHHVRLVRTRTTIDLALFDLGEDEPDISLHAKSDADWRTQFGLAAGVVHIIADWPTVFDGVLWRSDRHSFESAPADDFAQDRYSQVRALDDSNRVSMAVNVLKVIRDAQRWLRYLTRRDDADFRWGAGATALPTLYADIEGEGTSFHRTGSEAINLGTDRSGKGADGWDDPVIVHEMSHWIMDKSQQPVPAFKVRGGDHSLSQQQNAGLTISEGYAEYHQLFWGSEFGRIEPVRGFALAGRNSTLDNVFRVKGSTNYLFGGPASAPAPAFTTPGDAVDCEGYFANTLWQIHHAISEPGVLLADAPNYWYRHNAVTTDAQADRYAQVMRRSLRNFPRKPTDDEFETGSRTYARQLQRMATLVNARTQEIVASLLELNNLVNPALTVTPPGAISPKVNAVTNLSAKVLDADGKPLPGYAVTVAATTGGIAFPGAPAARRRGSTSGTPTDATGTVNFTYTAPAAAGKDTITVSVQPDFDDDATFALPQPGDNLETTQTQLYLYELRGANKTWAGAGSNRGAIVSQVINVDVKP